MEHINTIYIAGIRIDEPIVSLTDLIVAGLCFYFAWKIHKAGKSHKVFRNFKIYFFVMGVATTFGGLIGHAFLYHFSFYWKLPGWITSMISIMFVERAAIEHTRIRLHEKTVQVLSVLNIVEFLTFLTLTIVSLDFFYVEFHSGYGLMFVVLSLELFLYIKTRNRASLNMLIGIGFAAIAALVFMNKLSPHPWFNYLSTSHILMTAAATFFYIGTTKLNMQEASSNAS